MIVNRDVDRMPLKAGLQAPKRMGMKRAHMEGLLQHHLELSGVLKRETQGRQGKRAEQLIRGTG